MHGTHLAKTKKIDDSLVYTQGIFHRRLTLWQGIALIVSSTIGAGVLGLPYAIAQSGVMIGVLYIVVLGFCMIMFNLMIGRVVSGISKPIQLTGLARTYLGAWGGYLMTAIVYLMLTGVLVIYLIGQGQALSTLFGGSPFVWTLGFFVVGSLLIMIGMRTIKVVELVLMIGVLGVVFLIFLASAPHVEIANMTYHNLIGMFVPYGVVLFAFHSATSIPEAYTIMQKDTKTFKRAIIYSGLIVMVVYACFAVLVVGVMGSETTEIATIGLESFIGRKAFILGNAFAVLAMGTSFLITGLALRDSLVWDYRIKSSLATVLVCVVPLLIFGLGMRSFIGMIELVGGVLISIELFLIILIYWIAYRRGDLRRHSFPLHHMALFSIPLIITLAIGAVYSVMKLWS